MHTHLPPGPAEGEGLLLNDVKMLKMELARLIEDSAKAAEQLQMARADADRAQQKRRKMEEQLNRTVNEKLMLEDKLKAQKKAAKDWKMKLDETTYRMVPKQYKVSAFQHKRLEEREN